jgi:hypothetical protein
MSQTELKGKIVINSRKAVKTRRSVRIRTHAKKVATTWHK